MQPRFTKPEKNRLLTIARKAIASYLDNSSLPDSQPQEEALSNEHGCFVSLKQDGALRGCIGSFVGDKPLFRLVQEMAVAAAIKDPRFYPLSRPELDQLKIEISVLSPLRKIAAIDEIKIGEHGVYIEKNVNRGVLLPQVATEYGWDRETFLHQTCLKAGLKEDAWKENCTIYIFNAEVFCEK